ncbi:MAG: hypothetical protein ACQEXV_15820 [Bacillota bacterium]
MTTGRAEQRPGSRICNPQRDGADQFQVLGTVDPLSANHQPDYKATMMQYGMTEAWST